MRKKAENYMLFYNSAAVYKGQNHSLLSWYLITMKSDRDEFKTI